MSFFYPQAALILSVSWEDFKSTSEAKKAKTATFPVLAKRVTVSINDYTSADTFSAEIDYHDFPFDPRCIRSIACSVFMEDMKSLTDSAGKPTKIVPSSKNVVFQGFADEESISLDESDMTVKFEGRDYTGLLIDAPYPEATVPLTTPLDLIIQQMLLTLKSTSNLKVDNRTSASLPNLGKFAPDYTANAQKKNVKRKESYWEVIQDLVSRAGLIAFIEIDKLVISKPRNVFSRSTGYEFIYGKNLKSLEFKRKLGRQKGMNILVRSLNLESKEVLEAKIPEEATETWCAELGIKREPIQIEKIDSKGQKEVQVAPYTAFRIKDVHSKEQLVKIGEGLFEEIGRQQIEGSLATQDMVSLQGTAGSAKQFDITKIRNGTPVRIEIDLQDLKELARMERTQVRASYLRRKGYLPRVADALAQSLGHFDTTFYTKSVDFTVDRQEGFNMKLDFVNFIELEGQK